MTHSDDPYRLKEKTNRQLHEWLIEYEQGTDEYAAGIEESMRRIALMEEVMEKKEAPVWRRESIAMSLAAVAIAVLIIAVVIMYQ
jgi:hypothetical protein